MVRTVGQRQAELAFQLSILFDPQAALKVNVNPWMFIILLDGDVLYSYLTGWPSGRIGREQREGSNFLLKDSELGKVLLLTHGLLQINFV